MVVTKSSCLRETKVVSGIPIKANNVPGTAQSANQTFSREATSTPTPESKLAAFEPQPRGRTLVLEEQPESEFCAAQDNQQSARI